MTKKKLRVLRFRWSVKQLSPTDVEVLTSPNGEPLLHQSFADTLSDKEIDEAEYMLIQAFALLKDE